MIKKLYIIPSTLILVLFLSCDKDQHETSTPGHFQQGLEDGINYGLAASYPNDQGIENDPDVLAFENFESGLVEIFTEENRFKNNINVVKTDPRQGNYCGEYSWSNGHHGPTSRFPIPAHAHEGRRPAYFVRMYIKYDESFHPYYGSEPPETGSYKDVGIKGFGIANEKVNPSSAIPDGTNWYNAQVQFVGWGPSAKREANDKYLWVGHLYSFNPSADSATPLVGGNLRVSQSSTQGYGYRFSAYANPFEYLQYNRWYCFEIGLYLNTPGKHDGEARFWIDGVLQTRTVNIRFRDVEDLLPMYVHLNLHRTTASFPHTMKRYVDNIVIARRYIGPIKD